MARVQCAVCREPIHEPPREAYCTGCRSHICLDCDEEWDLGPRHQAKDHRRVTHSNGPDIDDL